MKNLKIFAVFVKALPILSNRRSTLCVWNPSVGTPMRTLMRYPIAHPVVEVPTAKIISITPTTNRTRRRINSRSLGELDATGLECETKSVEGLASKNGSPSIGKLTLLPESIKANEY
jgi:hypothetical protein